MKVKNRMTNALKIQKIMLSVTCTWPKEDDTLLRRIILFVWGLLCLIYIMLIHVESIIILDDIAKTSSLMQITIPLTSYYFKFVAFIYNRQLFMEMLKLLDDDIFYQHDDKLNVHIEKAIKNALFFTKFFGGTVVTFVTIYVFLPVVNGTEYPTPLSTDFGSYKPLIYFIQAAGMIQAATNNSAIDCLCLTLLTLGACQFDVLKAKITEVRKYAMDEINDEINCENFDTDQLDEVIVKSLKSIVKHHDALIRFLELFEEIFSFGLLMQFLTSICSLSVAGFSLLLIPPTVMEFLSVILILIMLLSEIFIYCYFGDNVMTKSIEVGTACYFSEWYNCNSKVRNMLLVIIHRSQKPVTITIMKFAAFSLQLFASILRMSYSYFALLLRMSNKND